MSKSGASKYLSKLKAWAKREGLVQVEVPTALDEFFVNPNRIPRESYSQAQMLFEDWFLMERPLNRAHRTPLELFIQDHERKVKDAELDVYRRFARECRYGIFKISDVAPGQNLKMKLMPGGPEFNVVEVEGSKEAKNGDYFIGRLVPFQDHWVISSLLGVYPSNEAYHLDRAFAEKSGSFQSADLKPRHLLSLLLPKIDWHKEGLSRVKARLSMILQRWKAADLTVSQIERDILDAHSKRALMHPLFDAVISRAPSGEDAKEVSELLTAFWNLTMPERDFPRGPKETMLFGDLRRFVMSRITDEELKNEDAGAAKARELTRRWLDAPQAELGGKTPRETIIAERKSLGNPREECDFLIRPAQIEIGGEEARGMTLANQAVDYLKEKMAKEALECLQKAYPLMKSNPEVFRVLGNMATAYAMLGRREEAVDALRAALKANPDYGPARNNLHILENLTPAEFKRKHKAGFFGKMEVIQERRK